MDTQVGINAQMSEKPTWVCTKQYPGRFFLVVPTGNGLQARCPATQAKKNAPRSPGMAAGLRGLLPQVR